MNNTAKRYFLGLSLTASSLLAVSTASALPFPKFDARTAALGGIGIAHGIRNAAYYNPALASLEPEGYDSYIAAPSKGDFESDADDVKSGVEDIVAGGGNVADILNKTYQKYDYEVVQITIPTPFLGGAAYIADYTYQTEKVINNTELSHRAISIFETGVSVAQLQDVMWAENVLVGVTIKLMLIESYGYQEALANADFSLNNDELQRKSVLNFDFGMSKEYGVWKTGFVVKNLLSRANDYGNSDDEYTIEPQLRAGLAYQSRRAVFEFDLDLTKNEAIGYGSDTMFASFGWEWSIFRAFDVRLGYQQNLVGDKNAAFSGGLGLRLWSLLLDFSASVDPDGRGTYVQASWEF